MYMQIRVLEVTKTTESEFETFKLTTVTYCTACAIF